MALEELYSSPIFSLPQTLIILIIIWTIIWKGFALWRAGRTNSPVWFVVLILVNTLGILEILYLFVFSKTGKKTLQEKKKRKLGK